jgi:hypothetical protein
MGPQRGLDTDALIRTDGTRRANGTSAARALPLRSMMNSSWRSATRFSKSPMRWRIPIVETRSAMHHSQLVQLHVFE